MSGLPVGTAIAAVDVAEHDLSVMECKTQCTGVGRCPGTPRHGALPGGCP